MYHVSGIPETWAQPIRCLNRLRDSRVDSTPIRSVVVLLSLNRKETIRGIRISSDHGTGRSTQAAARPRSAIESRLVPDKKTTEPVAGCALVQRGATPCQSETLPSARRFDLPPRPFRSGGRRDRPPSPPRTRRGAAPGSRDRLSALSPGGIGESWRHRRLVTVSRLFHGRAPVP